MNNILKKELFKKNTKPVLIAHIPFLKELFVPVDGNHRIVTAVLENKAFIPSIYLNIHDHSKALSKYSSTLFKICCNLQCYLLYFSGFYSKQQLTHYLFEI